MIKDAEAVLSYWLEEVGPEGWSAPDAAAELKSIEFKMLWSRAAAGELGAWILNERSCLALLILLDQMPRLMFRGRADAYGSDGLALAIAKRAIAMGHDLKVDDTARLFFYTPLMHSESLMDQERCVRLVSLRLPKATQALLLDVKAHRETIRQFGRFPNRNSILGRRNTEAESAFLLSGGYRVQPGVTVAA